MGGYLPKRTTFVYDYLGNMTNIIKFVPYTGTNDTPPSSKWVGRIVIFELITGSRIQGKILAISEDWIDMDTGAVKIEHIVHAKWVSTEEANIIRGGPIQPWGGPILR
jgi:hypothetical protein